MKRIYYLQTSDPNVLYSTRDYNGIRVFIDVAKGKLELKDSSTNKVVFTAKSKNKAVLFRKAKKALITLGVVFEEETRKHD